MAAERLAAGICERGVARAQKYNGSAAPTPGYLCAWETEHRYRARGERVQELSERDRRELLRRLHSTSSCLQRMGALHSHPKPRQISREHLFPHRRRSGIQAIFNTHSTYCGLICAFSSSDNGNSQDERTRIAAASWL
jgi:hypothetical protein